MVKKRTLNELRQVKDSVYIAPKIVNDYFVKINLDPQYVVDLIKKYPNDQELGGELRKYYNSLKND